MSTLEIPEVTGVMLLPDCTLFPHGGLPLRIFEPRYLEMLDDALKGSCFFAVACLKGEETDEPTDCAESIGTIGLIRAAREMEDGTYNLLLHGVIRVRFIEWLDDSMYPKARIRPMPQVFEPEDQSASALASLHEAGEYATTDLPAEAKEAYHSMTSMIDDPAVLADVICQQFIHDPAERHELLSMDSVASRIAWLCSKLHP